MRLLEREACLASLAEYAQQAATGNGRLVLVAGEAGAGKSALLEQFQRRAAGGQLVLGRLRRPVHAAPARSAVRPRRHLGGELLELCRAGAAATSCSTRCCGG